MNTTQTQRYETPTFDPRGAFARTMRGGEMALEAARQKQELAEPQPFATQTFDPRGAFSRTLRSGEIAVRDLQRRRNLAPATVLAA